MHQHLFWALGVRQLQNKEEPSGDNVIEQLGSVSDSSKPPPALLREEQMKPRDGEKIVLNLKLS